MGRTSINRVKPFTKQRRESQWLVRIDGVQLESVRIEDSIQRSRQKRLWSCAGNKSMEALGAVLIQKPYGLEILGRKVREALDQVQT